MNSNISNPSYLKMAWTLKLGWTRQRAALIMLAVSGPRTPTSLMNS